MEKDICVAIISSDPFARNWMALLIARDWRTRVTAEVDSISKLGAVLNNINTRPDMVLFDIDAIEGEAGITQLWETFAKTKQTPLVLCIGSRANREAFSRLLRPGSAGYILKDEIDYSLGWAVTLAKEDDWVITPALQQLYFASRHIIEKPCLVLDGRKKTNKLTEQETRAARLAFLFSMERRELANELKIGEDWTYGMVSKIYEKLGLKDLLSDEVDPRDYLGDNRLVLRHFDQIRKSFSGSGKAKDMETLAFHLLTMPDVREIR